MFPIAIATFYKFVALDDSVTLRPLLFDVCERNDVKGTILLAGEGINGTIAGGTDGVEAVLAWLRGDARLADLEHKASAAANMPFHRLKVRLKKQIVTLGAAGVDAARMAGTYVDPQDWNRLIDDPDVVVIDTRNDYEVAIGSFEGAIDPRTRVFSDLPSWLDAHPELTEKRKIAMFCTGGIRCEKSTAYLRSHGFDEVYHLRGGILKYLETVPESQSRWRGECFVFDERVAVGHGLSAGTHTLCRSCRRPLNEGDRRSPQYVEGISCAHCHAQRGEDKKRNLAERQRQVELAARRGVLHVGARAPEKSGRACATPAVDNEDRSTKPAKIQ
jgi:UPF0176 protein